MTALTTLAPKEVVLKVTIYDLNLLVYFINNLNATIWSTAKMGDKAALSLAFILSKKLRKKQIDKEQAINKMFNIKLLYHEAYALYVILLNQKDKIEIEADDYLSEVKIQQIINELDQALK
ncbi:hypothetical protein ETU10_07225 [Apibacter muscae]|uniref:hypothetical protein n=1 Tax=Apibacter muscae TaxID=2509004 RepID=UPI0011AC3189|nr:hypothetical protein [Apibacter muscae]TWP23507.1 hypothetical protein ETU10_07225 [Apibacter muscae]